MSYAHEVDGLMSERDFNTLLRFQDSSYRRNAMMTPVVRDLLDDSITGYDWAVRHESFVSRIAEFAFEQRMLSSEVVDPSLRRHLAGFAELTQRQADAFAKLRQAFISRDQAAATLHWDEVALTGRLRLQMGAPIFARLREKLGAEFVDRHLDFYLNQLVKGVTAR